MKFLYFTDPHQSDHAPASRKDDYREAIFDKFDQIGRIISKLKIDVVLCGGDWFNLKAATRNSHYLVRRMIDVLRSWNVPVWSVAGSHDFPWNQVEKLDKQPLGVMISAGVVQLLDWWTDKTAEFVIVGEKHSFPRARVIGFNDDSKASLDGFARIKKASDEVLIAVAHYAGSPDRDPSKFFDAFCYEDLVDFAPDIWCFGHWHIDQGVVSLKAKDGSDKFFISPGALSRGAYNDDNIGRTPKVVIIEVNGGIRITPVSLKVKSTDEVFDVEKLEKLKQKDREISKFIEELTLTDQLDSVEDIKGALERLSLKDSVRRQVQFYLSQVDSQNV